MKKELIGSTAIVGALLGATAVPAVADPDPTPPPYCAGASPGDSEAEVSPATTS